MPNEALPQTDEVYRGGLAVGDRIPLQDPVLLGFVVWAGVGLPGLHGPKLENVSPGAK